MSLKLTLDGIDHQVETLRLHPGDILVITVTDPTRLTSLQSDELLDRIGQIVGDDVKVMVMDGMSVSVVRPTEEPPS